MGREREVLRKRWQRAELLWMLNFFGNGEGNVLCTRGKQTMVANWIVFA